jgi:hypothetical protein
LLLGDIRNVEKGKGQFQEFRGIGVLESLYRSKKIYYYAGEKVSKGGEVCFNR